MFGVQGWKSQEISLKRKVPEQSCVRKGGVEPWGWDGEGIISSPLKEGEKDLWMEQKQGAPAGVPGSPLQGGWSIPRTALGICSNLPCADFLPFPFSLVCPLWLLPAYTSCPRQFTSATSALAKGQKDLEVFRSHGRDMDAGAHSSSSRILYLL